MLTLADSIVIPHDLTKLCVNYAWHVQMMGHNLRSYLGQSLHRGGLLARVEGEGRIVTIPTQWSILIRRVYWRRLHDKPGIDELAVITRRHFNVSL